MSAPLATRLHRVTLIGIVSLLTAAFLGLTLGSMPLSLLDIWEALLHTAPTDQPSAQMTRAIILDIRLPRVLAGAAAGAVLALGGLVCQVLLRNPLAEPYILGISGGAAVGTIVAILWGLSAFMHTSLAFVGGMGVMTLILLTHARARSAFSEHLLLSGVMVNAFCGALILFLISLARSSELSSIMFWFMGNLGACTASQAVLLLALVTPCLGIVLLTSHRMNALLLGDEAAQSMGVPVLRQSLVWIVLMAFAVSVTVSLVGPLGFVGLIVPQCTRLMLGHDHRVLAPASALFGATFLVLCDVLARTLSDQGELPVGVVTALLGAPAFMILLRRRT